MKFRKPKKRYIIPISILVILIVVRILLPGWVTNYVNKVLDEIPGYTGSITNVDLHLYRGAYVIDSLTLNKVESDVEIPFVFVDRTDLSVQWAAIFNGAIVGEIEFLNPDLNFVAASSSDDTQYGDDVDWTKPITDLLPLQINRMEIENGSIRYVDVSASPEVDITIDQIQAEVLNLNNASRQETELPSPLKFSGVSIGQGVLDITGDLNIIKEIPDLDLDVKFEKVNLPDLNNFLRAYANVDAEQGVFNLYSEIAVRDGSIKGYVKPIMDNLKIFTWKEDKDRPLNLVWQGIVGFVSELFENQRKDQFASKVPLSGTIDETKARVLPAIWNVFKNAFFGALKKQTDDTIDFESVE